MHDPSDIFSTSVATSAKEAMKEDHIASFILVKNNAIIPEIVAINPTILAIITEGFPVGGSVGRGLI